MAPPSVVVHSVLLPVGSQRPSEPLLKARKLPTGPAGPETTCDQVRPPSVERSSRDWLATLTCTTSDEDDTAICWPRTPAGRVIATPYVAPKSCDTRTVTGPPERRAWQSTANEPGGPMAADTASLSVGEFWAAGLQGSVRAVQVRPRSTLAMTSAWVEPDPPDPHPACTSPTGHLLDVGPLRASRAPIDRRAVCTRGECALKQPGGCRVTGIVARRAPEG